MTPAAKKLRQLTHRTIDAITTALETFACNLAVARAYELVGALVGESPTDPSLLAARREALETLARLIAPMVPHIAETINHTLNPNAPLVATQPWPKADPALLVQDEVTIAVQVNGKLRGTILVPAGADKTANLAIAKQAVSGALIGSQIVKEIYVPDRIVNFVVKP
jgi:leucyl-tRNA synthetase